MAASLPPSVETFSALLKSLAPTLVSLKRFEANFGDDAKQTLEGSIKAANNAIVLTASWKPASGIAGYLQAGTSVGELKAAQTQLQQALATILAGGIPLPRSSKDDLSNMRTELQGLKLEASAEQIQYLAQLKKLYNNATDANFDIDVVEAKLDEVVRNLIAQTYDGATSLPEEDLHRELQSVRDNIAVLKGSSGVGAEDAAAVLSLVANSLERLHGQHMPHDDSEEEEEEAAEEEQQEEDDEDDPFYMPLPSALKMADATKFTLLSKPLGPEEPSPFMIKMETDTPTSGQGSTTFTESASSQQEAPGLTDKDFEPVPEDQVRTSLTGAASAGTDTMVAAARLASLSIPSPEESGEVPAGEPSSTQQLEAAGALSPGAAHAAADGGEGLVVIPGPIATSPQPNDEKLKQFVNFLHGDNPGACMFHAQMRLSLEGCRKLSNFIRGSGRVRALSLSHNHIGDDGLKILCEGLIVNKSVTALDLPDNDISDIGVAELIQALVHNTSLTQLQLAYNKVGNEGALALAKFIKESQSLKKLGLSYNQIGRQGCQALTGAISTNQSLKHLQLLPGNPVEEKDAKALAKALKRNTKFSIRAFLGMGGVE